MFSEGIHQSEFLGEYLRDAQKRLFHLHGYPGSISDPIEFEHERLEI